jgi:hypothetical protein
MYFWVQAVDDDSYNGKITSPDKEGYVWADVNPVKLSTIKGQNTSALTGPAVGQAIDNIAPTEATFVRAMDTQGDAGGSITVTWNLSTEDRVVGYSQDLFGVSHCIYGVTEYHIYRDGDLIGAVSKGVSEYADNVGCQNDVVYEYVVKAFDGTFEIESAADDARPEDNTVTGDFNSDGLVNMDDLMRLGLHWELTDADIKFDWLYDLNTDGEVDMSDVIILGQNWTGKASSSGFGLNSGAQTGAEVIHEANSKVSLNIRAENVRSLIGYQLKVKYDSESATFVEAKLGDLLLNNEDGKTPLLLVKKGVNEVSIASVIPRTDEGTAVNGNGCLIQLKFITNQPEFEVTEVGLLDIDGNIDMLGTMTARGEIVSGIPEVCELYQNCPNPFVVNTSIEYGIPVSMAVKLAVYNIAGQEVRTLADGVKEAGYHTVRWDGNDNNGSKVNSGIYFYRLKTEDSTIQKKLIIVQ